MGKECESKRMALYGSSSDYNITNKKWQALKSCDILQINIEYWWIRTSAFDSAYAHTRETWYIIQMGQINL